ncbi:unnamed protein product [Soboliphyme baturini]|uniref:CUE domain-containing protein n=1 Tax=Soboliphyme baturini TaxID=241478 RepID=A0A183J9M6_9BILA|nr:unnamed protein product [Soboliphyme baturini]
MRTYEGGKSRSNFPYMLDEANSKHLDRKVEQVTKQTPTENHRHDTDVSDESDDNACCAAPRGYHENGGESSDAGPLILNTVAADRKCPSQPQASQDNFSILYEIFPRESVDRLLSERPGENNVELLAAQLVDCVEISDHQVAASVDEL